jgi:hypothetical protein
MHGRHDDLHGSCRQSVIPYVHEENVVLVSVWCCSSQKLNLVATIVHPAFYSSRPGNYTVTQGPTDGPKVAGSLYSSYGIKC